MPDAIILTLITASRTTSGKSAGERTERKRNFGCMGTVSHHYVSATVYPRPGVVDH